MLKIFVKPYSIQEKGKLSLEEFTLDAERRAHGMRSVMYRFFSGTPSKKSVLSGVLWYHLLHNIFFLQKKIFFFEI